MCFLHVHEYRPSIGSGSGFDEVNPSVEPEQHPVGPQSTRQADIVYMYEETTMGSTWGQHDGPQC